MSESVKITGLVIRRARYKEAHMMLTLLTGDHGKISVAAPGVLSLKNKNFAGSGLFCFSEFVLKKKSPALYSLSECTLIESFHGLSLSLERQALACYFAELAKLLAPENSPSDRLLRLILNGYHFLAKTKRSAKDVRLGFEAGALSYAGFAPQLSSCVRCGADSDLVGFSAEAGGALCRNCHRGSVVPEKALALLSFLFGGDMKALYSFEAAPADVAAATALTEQMILFHIADHLPTLDFFKSVRGI